MKEPSYDLNHVFLLLFVIKIIVCWVNAYCNGVMNDPNLQITYRHFHPTEALKKNIYERLNKILKNPFLRMRAANCVLSIDGHEHKMQITFFGNHMSFFAEGISHDMYVSIEIASKKMESQIRRFKNKVKKPCVTSNFFLTCSEKESPYEITE